MANTMGSDPRRGRLATLFALLAAGLMGRARRYEIAEHSMRPTLHHGDWVIAIPTRELRPGDVVVLQHPNRPGFDLVKRIRSIDEAGVTVLGDHREAGSVDSTSFGAVTADSIRSRVAVRYWPWPPRIVR